MITPIDELLVWLRAREEDCLLVADAALPKHVPLVQAEIDRIGRYIAAVDELLASLRDSEYWLRRFSVGDASAHAKRDLEKADTIARQIAAVEELVAFKASHLGLMHTVVDQLAAKGAQVLLDSDTAEQDHGS